MTYVRMAYPADQPPDSARDDIVAVALGIGGWLLIFLLSSWIPA